MYLFCNYKINKNQQKSTDFTPITPKINKYECVVCEFYTRNKNDYNRHISSAKHYKKTNLKNYDWPMQNIDKAQSQSFEKYDRQCDWLPRQTCPYPKGHERGR